jgi:hypothetical protein
MTRPIYADIPKFKRVERKLHLILRDQIDAVKMLQSAQATQHEQQFLDASEEECQKASECIRRAVEHLYQAFKKPSE